MCREDPRNDSPLDGGHLHVEPAAGTTRRAALGAAGAGGAALLFAGLQGGPAGALSGLLGPDLAEAAATSCVMTPAKVEGPFFVDDRLDRSDVRPDTRTGAAQAGQPLTLRMQLFDADAGCAPVRGATVDVWHTNAAGRYSDITQEGTKGQNWLRGFQTTDADGLVTFTTIYPGWYPGRAVHIHFKVRVPTGPASTLELVSQLFFTDEMNTRVYTSTAPYSARSPQAADTPNGRDGILGSDAPTLTLAPVDDGRSGLTADFSVGLRRGADGNTTAVRDTAVGATLQAATMLRTALGARRLRVRLAVQEPVTVTARLTRGGRRIATRTVRLQPGTRDVRLAVPSATAPGAAQLRLTFADAAGNRRTTTRTVVVARRSRS